MGDNTVIAAALDPRRASSGQQHSKLKSSSNSSLPNTPVSCTKSTVHPRTIRNEVTKYTRKHPRLETTQYKSVKKIIGPKLYDDLIRYDCVMDKDGQEKEVNLNVAHLRVQDIAEFELKANRVGASIMYNKDYGLPIADKVRLIKNFKDKEGKDIPYALLRYQNDFHHLLHLKDACHHHAVLVEDYFKRTLFNSV